MNQSLKELIKIWESSGRAIHVYPRKKRISLNGISRPFDEAEKYLKDFLTR